METPRKPRTELERSLEVEDWDGCLRLFGVLEEGGALRAHELVQKSTCAQLGVELGSLEEAETALSAALELAADYLPALIALGWFQFAVQDDARTGLAHFTRAEELCRAYLEEVLEGKKQCVEELGDEEKVV